MAYLKSKNARLQTHTLYRVITRLSQKIESGELTKEQGQQEIEDARKDFKQLQSKKKKQKIHSAVHAP